MGKKDESALRLEMAARQASRRVLSFLFNQHTPSSLPNESSGQFLPSTTTIFTRNEFCRRRIQTQAQVTNPENTPDQSQGIKDSVSFSGLDDVASQLGSGEVASVGGTVVSNLKPSPRHDMAAMFTCKVCDTRSLKTFARESYEKGIVVARCGGCNNLHMLADRLGWFGEPSSVEELLAAHGEEVKKGSADTLSLTLEDLAGSAVKS